MALLLQRRLNDTAGAVESLYSVLKYIHDRIDRANERMDKLTMILYEYGKGDMTAIDRIEMFPGTSVVMRNPSSPWSDPRSAQYQAPALCRRMWRRGFSDDREFESEDKDLEKK